MVQTPDPPTKPDAHLQRYINHECPSFHHIPFNKRIQFRVFKTSFNLSKFSDKIPLELKRFRLTSTGQAHFSFLVACGIVTYVAQDKL
jgi:hypothetical protein